MKDSGAGFAAGNLTKSPLRDVAGPGDHRRAALTQQDHDPKTQDRKLEDHDSTESPLFQGKMSRCLRGPFS